MDDLELRVAWERHVSVDMQEFDAVLARHREPHRMYHGARHVRWVVRHALQLAARYTTTPNSTVQNARHVDIGAVTAAAFYHDAIYDPRAADNEAASARLATEVLTRSGWPPDRVDSVAAMIEATAGHDHVGSDADDGGDVSTAVLLAADLAVLAADPPGYSAYVNGVRFEYSHVLDSDWVVGRSAVLQRFIDRDHIYPAVLDLVDWEARARANITAELAALKATS